jgi:probable lipoprotein NlpC
MIKKGLFFLLVVLVMAACKGSKKTTSSKSSKGKTTKTSTHKTKSTPSKEESKADKVIKTARSYTGTPYRYGGTTRAGIDCSGLACAAFKSAEVTLPRTSQAQSTFGKAVSLKDIQRGDLVFFTDRKGSKKITHVGIVTEVKGAENAKFIHASTKLGVVENDLYSTYYKPLILKAVRVL